MRASGVFFYFFYYNVSVKDEVGKIIFLLLFALKNYLNCSMGGSCSVYNITSC